MISLLIVVLILGLIAWAIGALPVAQPFRTIAYVILVIILLLVLLQAVGLVSVHQPVILR